MSCERIRQNLDDYELGRLDPALWAAVEEHLRDCAPCRRELRRARVLRRELEGLPAEWRPGRDLWPGIAARLGHTPSRGGILGVPWVTIRRVAAAAAVAALLAFAWLRGEGRPVDPPGETRAQAAAAVPTELGRRREGTIHVYRDLAASFARHRGQGDPAAAAALAAGLEELERAVGEVQAALQQHPEDRALHRLLADAYRRESGWASRLSRI